MSGNSTTNISDHLPQFAIIPNMFGNTTSKFDRENFILDYFSID